MGKVIFRKGDVNFYTETTQKKTTLNRLIEIWAILQSFSLFHIHYHYLGHGSQLAQELTL